ncbi:hypothetical protein ACFONG_01025 [Uliginosibacterium paludis]|uniref:Uncharacterized protein n=1 Tax=Uliginosibacterium paludis TaxID=1615952 RepID=A0ABV2CR64_9RHOO
MKLLNNLQYRTARDLQSVGVTFAQLCLLYSFSPEEMLDALSLASRGIFGA